MPTEISASDMSTLVRDGHDRVRHYRRAARDAIREFAGNSFVKPQGFTGESPINLLFIALRTWVPNLAARSGVNRVITDMLAQKDYANLLGLGLDNLHRKIHMQSIIRAGIVNMILGGLAIFKTSLAATDNLLPVGDDVNIDPGQIYTDLVSLDDFFFDAHCTALSRASFLGHYVTVRRQDLLDQEGWDHDLVMRLSSADVEPQSEDTTKMLSQDRTGRLKVIQAQDYVRVAEVYLPEAQAIAYVPDPHQNTFDEFLKVMEYYGPSTGPYRFGSLTPPVPDNPLPIAPVSMWRDLNAMANNIFVKFMDQADRQKDILLYKPGMEDIADAIRDALDGETIRTSDPEGVKVVSYGGANPDNDKMVNQLQTWFNYVAGNPDQAAGVKIPQGAKTATATSILQSNASVTQEDAKSLIYDLQAGISSDQAWYMHHDPFLDILAATRETGQAAVQVRLTPEQRVGAYEHLIFKIVKRSMQEMDPVVRRKMLEDFAARVLPTGVQSAMVMSQLGYPFDLVRYLSQMADEMGISDVMAEIFVDPTFQRRMLMVEQNAPKQTGTGMDGLKGILQNGGSPNAGAPAPTGQQQFNQNAQAGAADSQALIQGAL